MHISSAARAPKSQMAGEPSTWRHWNPPKEDTPHPRKMKKPQWNSRRGIIMIKTKSYTHWVCNSQSGEQYQRSSQHCCEACRLHIRLASLEIWWRDEKPQGFWLWRPTDLTTQLPLDWRKQRLSEGTNKILCAPGPREKEQWPLQRLCLTYL